MGTLTISLCNVCRVVKTANGTCYDCKKRAKKKANSRVYAQRTAARLDEGLRQAVQERKEDEAASRLFIGPVMELQPCHRCGRAVLVQVIPVEERRRLGTLPEAVECEKPCEMRVVT